MQKRIFSLLLTIFFALKISAEVVDTTTIVEIQEVEVVSLKEYAPLRQLPSSVTRINEKQLDDNHITSLKGVSGIVPNLFIPDYGSRLTSAVYIRGIGSRINTPAVGLYVDNIPFTDKSGFDFNFYDINRIEVMRGPQGTLYGRNTMGGVIKVFTLSPLFFQGTTAKLGYSSGDNRRTVSLTHYSRPWDSFAFSVGGYYEGSDGFYTNDITGKKVDALQAGGGRIRAIWGPIKKLNIGMNVSYDYSDEGAYPYFYTGTLDGNENFIKTGIDGNTGNDVYKYDLSQYKNKITNNRESSYRRGMFNASLSASYDAKNFRVNSMTSYQNLNDRMFMDQDFLNADIYTIEQKQRINTLTEELVVRNKNDYYWERVSGINLMGQWLHTTGPVTFCEDGLRWLESNINTVFDNPKIPFMMRINFNGDNLVMGGVFDTPTLNAAAFHQSTYHFNDYLSATVGLRLDYEKNSIKYDAPAVVDYTYSMPFLTLDLTSNIDEYNGSMHTDYLKLLPKFALKYDFNQENNVYVSASKGMRSGGYNIQGFSEMLQGALKHTMMEGVKAGIIKKLPFMEESLNNMMPTTEMPDVKNIEYRPEYSWNYELGTHLTMAQRKIKLDAAVYYINTKDQQVARFVSSGLGRILVNAGESESYGAELSALWQITDRLELTGNYGFTHSQFTNYDGGSNNGTTIDYSGCYVPFVPKHTVNGDLAYTLPLGKMENGEFWRAITFGVNYSGAGRIYWTEANDASQNYYSTLGARINLETRLFSLQLWAKNITDAKYNTLYIVSVNRGFEQHGKPFQMGVDLKFEF